MYHFTTNFDSLEGLRCNVMLTSVGSLLVSYTVTHDIDQQKQHFWRQTQRAWPQFGQSIAFSIYATSISSIRAPILSLYRLSLEGFFYQHISRYDILCFFNAHASIFPFLQDLNCTKCFYFHFYISKNKSKREKRNKEDNKRFCGIFIFFFFFLSFKMRK